MASFYSTLYAKFADLQVDRSFSTKFVYPAVGSLPSLKVGKGISDCIVKIPSIRVAKNTISYGPFMLEDSEFGQAAVVKLATASVCLLSAKSLFCWLYRDYIQEWLASKRNTLRASYAINAILDKLARQRVSQVEGEDFYIDIMAAADLLASALLPRSPKNLDVLGETALVSLILNVPVHVPATILKAGQNFVSKLNSLKFDPSKLIDIIRDRISNDNKVEISAPESGWDHIAKLADLLYAAIEKIPGKWHSIYLPYSNALVAGSIDSIFRSRLVTEKEFNMISRRFMNKEVMGNDPMWKEIFFELQREEKWKEKTLSKLSRATKDLNFATTGFPISDYVSYHLLYTEIAPQIRKMVDRVRMVKNVLDESAFEESGSIDLQVAIQAVASETARSDIFVKDENLLKNESWTILVDSSLSLGGSSKEVKAVSICLAETAREIMGAVPWGMYAFSDELYCIKDYSEPYGNHVKARIGGLTHGGLSHIPDAIRACRSLIAEHAQDRNYLILVSDGLPSGYPGIEQEFAASVKELGRNGIDLAAISVSGSGIKKIIRKARVVEEPAEIVKEFMEIYYSLSG